MEQTDGNIDDAFEIPSRKPHKSGAQTKKAGS